jgi:surface protein
MDFIRSLPRDIRCRALPWSIRIIRSKAELVTAIGDAVLMVRGDDENDDVEDVYYYRWHDDWISDDPVHDYTAVMARWDVSSVDDFSHIFDVERNIALVRFKADLSGWDVSNATDLSHMFHGCKHFESDLSGWNVTRATNLSWMFYRCGSFNSDVSSWNVSNATDLSRMFYRCNSFNSDVSRWNVSRATLSRARQP